MKHSFLQLLGCAIFAIAIVFLLFDKPRSKIDSVEILFPVVDELKVDQANQIESQIINNYGAKIEIVSIAPR